MNEECWVQQLSAEVDQMLAGAPTSTPEDAPRQYRQALQMAERFAGLDFTDKPRQQALRRDLLNHASRQADTQGERGMNQPGPQRLPDHWAPTLAAFTLVGALMLTLAMPPLRVFAEEVLYQLGVLDLTRDQTGTEEALNNPIVLPAEPGVEPTVVPDGMGPEWLGAMYFSLYVPDRFTLETDTPMWPTYVHETSTTGDLRFFRIYSLASSLEAFPISDSPLSPVTVRGTGGSFVEGVPMYVKDLGRQMTQQELQVSEVNLLLWEENGTVYVVESNILSLNEMVKVAEALEP